MDEFLRWQIIYALEPWGSERGDLQAGIIASVICNALRGKSGRIAKPGDFLLKFEPPREKTPEEFDAFFRNLTVQMGGKVS